MIDGTHLFLFLLAGLLLNITPGPDMLYIIARSVGEGKKSGIASALGITAGCFFHLGAVALGGAALMATKPAWFRALQMGGAVYLVYIGIQSLRASSQRGATRAVEPARTWVVFRQGAVTNLLNPKVILFFFAFLPQFVDPSRGRATAQLVVLGLIFMFNGTIVNIIVANVASRLAGRMQTRFGDRLRKAAAVVVIGLGLRLAFSRAPA